jgi:hypothetical protein
MIILRWIFRKWDVGIELAQDRVVGTCECGDKPSGFTKCGGFLD